MHQQVKLRKVRSTELEKLKWISEKTFVEAFADVNDPTDMKLYIEKSFSKSQLLSELENEYSNFYFAIIDDRIVAYLKLNSGPAQSEIVTERSMEIERIYVLKDFQRMNIGKFLIHKSVELASKASIDMLWLGVWEENHNAIRFYEKLGFSPFDTHHFLLGNDLQSDILMQRKIV